MKEIQEKTRFLLCIETQDCEDIEKGKVYRVVPDEAVEVDAFVRVIDESGEDYLYPESYFVPVELPEKAQAALHIAS